MVAGDTARRQDVQSSGRCRRLHRASPSTHTASHAAATSVSRIKVLERRPAPMERADHSSAASGTFRFWPPGSRTVCHVSLTGLRQCPDPLNSPAQAASWRGVNAEVCLAPSGCLHRRFTSVRLGALLQTTARIPVGITALWISPFCLGDIRRCSMMGGRASAENHALTSPVIHPQAPVSPLTPRFPASRLTRGPIRHCDINVFLPCRMPDTYGPTWPAWQLKSWKSHRSMTGLGAAAPTLPPAQTGS